MLGAKSTDQTPLPDFGRPPVIEVVLSVQFEELELFAIPHVGLLWEKFRNAFPVTEQKAPLAAQFEKFDGPQESNVQLQFVSEPPLPRCWFHNVSRTELIQVQKDRFIFNWRRGDGDTEYPRYPVVRKKFEDHFETFTKFISDEGIGKIRPNQCEVTYINHVFWEGQDGHGIAATKIFPMISDVESDSFLPNPEELHLRWVYRLRDNGGNSVGRLHIAAEPRIRTTDQVPLYRIGLTARGAPFAESREGVLEFLDFAREQVVRGFASITSRAMHSVWERRDAR